MIKVSANVPYPPYIIRLQIGLVIAFLYKLKRTAVL